jgi:hypothetical protein
MIGIVAGACLPFVAVALVIAIGIGIGAFRYAWQGAPFVDVLLPSVLCLIFIQVGYAAGLMMKAGLIHAIRVHRVSLAWTRGLGPAADTAPETVAASRRRASPANATQAPLSQDKAPL